MEPLSPPPAAAVGRGTRPRHRQRDPHLVRTGCAWRLLPKEYPVAGGVLVLPAVVGRWQPEPTARRVAGPRGGALWKASMRPFGVTFFGTNARPRHDGRLCLVSIRLLA